MSDQQPTVHRSRGKRYLRAVNGQGSEAKNVHGADCGTERNGTCGGGCKCWCHVRPDEREGGYLMADQVERPDEGLRTAALRMLAATERKDIEIAPDDAAEHVAAAEELLRTAVDAAARLPEQPDERETDFEDRFGYPPLRRGESGTDLSLGAARPADEGVTDAMVEAALQRYHDPHHQPDQPEGSHESMRAALVAALAARPTVPEGPA